MRTRWIVAGWLAALALFACARVGYAEEPQDDLTKLREQAQKILDLMKRNETALLAASTGAEATPTKPEVDVPPPQAALPPASSARAEGATIPRELEELVRMWPT